MLNAYKKEHAKAVIQYSILDFNGIVLESDHVLFPSIEQKKIADVHPFFECLVPLLTTENETFTFSCIHLEYKNVKIIADVILQTFNNTKAPLLTIHDLTTHYNNYQTTAQVRNESVIHSQILELKNDYLKEKEDFKNAFIANFSHELRDPLTGIITFTDILEQSNLNHQQRDYLNVLKSSSGFLKDMIDDILDLSKIEVGKLDLVIEPFNLHELLEDLKLNCIVKAKQKGLEFYHDFDENLPKIIGGDVLRLRQVLTNLLNNAFKFTNEGSVTFNVSLNQIRAQKASIHFEVIDTGIGIKEENIEQIFNSFTQINNQDSYRGAGLGLSISKYLVELTKSKIKVESTFGKGSKFSTNINFRSTPNLKLPRKAVSKLSHLKKDKKYNILLVEDSEITQLSVLKILASKGQFFLDIVFTPEDVISKITNFDNEFDLVLMDIKLKENSGDDIAKLIRKLPEKQHRKIPIIALTAKVFKEDLKRYKKAGINDVIKKPFNEESLLEKMALYLK